MHKAPPALSLRDTVFSEDVDTVRDIVSSSGFFHPGEIDVAVELVQTHLANGPASGYWFLFGELGARTVGYACFGPIACTQGSFDLYWIAVHERDRHHGLGRALLAAAESRIAAVGGRGIYIETSSRAQYEPTRAFYEKCGYTCEATLAAFYAPGDDKMIYVKKLHDGAGAQSAMGS